MKKREIYYRMICSRLTAAEVKEWNESTRIIRRFARLKEDYR